MREGGEVIQVKISSLLSHVSFCKRIIDNRLSLIEERK